MTFNNPLKVDFSNKNYPITIQTRLLQIVKAFFIEKTVLNGFLKIVGAQNQLPITFCTDLMCNKDIKG